MLVPFFFCRGREIRTPINGFGDHYSALKLFPFKQKGIRKCPFVDICD